MRLGSATESNLLNIGAVEIRLLGPAPNIAVCLCGRPTWQTRVSLLPWRLETNRDLLPSESPCSAFIYNRT